MIRICLLVLSVLCTFMFDSVAQTTEDSEPASFLAYNSSWNEYYSQLIDSINTSPTGPMNPVRSGNIPDGAVGAMGGQFTVSPMGGATYSIPIEVPLGVGGLQPQLSIVYNSQSGNGLCGYGASLAGLSSITRGPKDIYHDGAAQGMKYLADDALYLDGVRLILSSGTAGQNGAVYHPESDPFTTVTVNGNCTSTSNNIWFEVQGSDGLVYEYGHTAGSRLSYNVGSSQRIHSWYIDRIQQPTGNYMTYYYQTTNSSMYPVQINYGGEIGNGSQLNTVTLNYENRSDSILLRFDGNQGRLDKRLKSITSRTRTNTFRTYTLNYDTIGDGTSFRFSRLTSVTEQNGQNESLPATQFEWSHLPSINYSATNLNSHFNELSSPTVSIDNQKFGSCDLNGDGIDDIIGYGRTSSDNDNKIYIYKYLSSRTGNDISFTVDHQYSFTASYSDVSGDVSDELIQELKSSTLGGSAVIDYDGDGRNEYLIGRIFKTYDMNANGTSTLNKYMEFFMLGEEDSFNYSRTRLITNSTPLYSTGDINNDGRSDLIILETQSYDDIFFKLHILSASVNPTEYTYNYMNLPVSNSVDYDLHLPYSPRQLFVADMNGNGLQDLLVIYDSGYSVFWNRGGNITGSNLMYNGNVSEYFHYGQELVAYHMMVPGDYNGDGIMDILANGSGTSTWLLFFSNGNGSFTCQTACTLNVSEQSFTDRDDDKFSCNVVDLDADGRSDVIVTKAYYGYNSNPSGEWGTFVQTDTYWLRSTGTSIDQVYHATSAIEADALSKRYLTGDFNGDGYVELINYGYDCVNGNNSNTDPVWRMYNNSNLTAQSGKVTFVTGDYGATTSITYSTLASQGIYTRGTSEPYPAPRYTIPLNVVSQTVQNNGAAGNLTTQYTYEGLRAHLQGKGLLGFTRMRSNCTSTGISTESGIKRWDTAHYIPQITYTKSILNGYTSSTTNNLTIIDKGQTKYFAYSSRVVDKGIYGDSIVTERTFDTIMGYPLTETATYGTNMFRSVSYTDYTTTRMGGVYRPQTVINGQRHPDDTSPFSTTTTYTYNTNGTVAARVDNYGSSKPLTTSYGYDQYGNITSLESSGSGISSCTTHYQYDATHRFPVRIYTNPASSVQKYTYDQWGYVLTSLDSINSSIDNKVTHTYDNWGVLIKTVYADSSEVTYTRGWDSNASRRWYVLEQGTARPWVKTWYDNLGREVLTESVGPMNMSEIGTVTYNARGQVTSRSTSNGDLYQWAYYEYDNRGDLFREARPGDSYIMYGHWGLSDGTRNEQVNNNGRITNYVYDAWGNLKSLTDPVSSLTNTYTSNGGIRQTSSGGATWTFGYDDRGNRTTMTDPDAGTTTYVYDALGRETGRTDARGIVYFTNYDYLGRVTKRRAGSATISYTYWTNGNGQLSLRSESLYGQTKSYDYDRYGRVIQETMSNGTETKTRSYTYGNNGLVSSATMPGGKAVQYTYDSYGNLTGLDFNSGTIVWSLAGYTGRRTVSQTVLDGASSYPFVKTLLLNQYGYLDSLNTVNNNYYFQKDKYTFDHIRGNLTQKSGYFDYSPYTYSYDNADRLRTVSDALGTRMSVTYSANGNITSKTGIGSYTYNSSSKPHAVIEVGNTDNLIEMNDQSLYYNDWNRLVRVWQTDEQDFYSYNIGYGPDMKRVGSEMYKTYNVQYSKFYWDDYEEKYVGNDTLCYWYVYTPTGLEGLYIEKHTTNGITSHTTKVITDHLGSIVSLIDNDDWVYDASYDAWGNRQVLMSYGFDPTFDRGYCGHEHIDELGLINMNGRMYDPLLARFLSPDPYVQAPTNPQNYNRYSYCLNNPLKYTDPSGEIIGIDDAVFACIIAAIAGAATDYGMQVAINFACGYTGKDAWFKKVDFFDIAVSCFVSGVSAGYGAAAKAGTKIGKLGKWVTGHGKAIKTGEILLTSAVDITGEGFQKISGGQFVLRATVGLTTQKVTDYISSYPDKRNLKLVKNKPKNEIATLGRFPEYVEMGEKNGTQLFQIPTEIWDSMTPEERWAANQKFLDDMIRNGAFFNLATPPYAPDNFNSYFEKEINYLLNNRYQMGINGAWLLPK